MELLGDEAQVQACFGPFGDSANLDVDRCMVSPSIPYAHKSFWTQPVVLLGDEAQLEACFVRLEIVLNLTRDRCTVCAEHTKGSEILLDIPDGTPRC
jgi:hypothetical protein